MKNNKDTIYIYLCILIIAIIYWSTNLHKNNKFKTLFTLIGGLGVLLAVYNIYRQYITDEKNFALDRSKTYSNLTQNFFTNTNLNVLDNTKNDGDVLDFFYASLTGSEHLLEDKEKSEKKRDRLKEFLYTSSIFDALGQVVVYIKYNSEYEEEYVISNIKSKVGNTIEKFMKNKDFFEYWKIYKGIYASPYLVDFMKKNFNT